MDCGRQVLRLSAGNLTQVAGGDHLPGLVVPLMQVVPRQEEIWAYVRPSTYLVVVGMDLTWAGALPAGIAPAVLHLNHAQWCRPHYEVGGAGDTAGARIPFLPANFGGAISEQTRSNDQVRQMRLPAHRDSGTPSRVQASRLLPVAKRLSQQIVLLAKSGDGTPKEVRHRFSWRHRPGPPSRERGEWNTASSL